MVEFYCTEYIGGRLVHYCYLEYKGVRFYVNQTLQANKGDQVTASYGIHGGSDGGRVAVQVWDWKNWRQLAWKEYDLSPYGTKFDSVSFTVDQDMEIGFVLYKLDGTWRQVSTYGKWIVKSTAVEEKPYFVIKNVWTGKKEYLPTEDVYVYCEIENRGYAGGYATIYVMVDAQTVKTDRVYISPGVTKSLVYNIGKLSPGTHSICVEVM